MKIVKNIADSIDQYAFGQFEEYFGSNEQEKAIFENGVLARLKGSYPNNPELIKKRLDEIIKAGFNASDLSRYLRSACIAEENPLRKLTYQEILTIIGEKPLQNGQNIYHFSNRKHKIGFEGHAGMCFTDEDDLWTVESGSLDKAEKVYSHTCEVLRPEGILDHTAIALAGDPENLRDKVIMEEFFGDMAYSKQLRWYELKDIGSIRVVEVKPALNRLKNPRNY